MPLFDLQCVADGCRLREERYIPLRGDANPACDHCGAPTERVWGRTPGDQGTGYPYVTKNILPGGQPVEVRDAGHLRALLKEHNLVQRDDAAFCEPMREWFDFGRWDHRKQEWVGRGVKRIEGTAPGGRGRWV